MSGAIKYLPNHPLLEKLQQLTAEQTTEAYNRALELIKKIHTAIHLDRFPQPIDPNTVISTFLLIMQNTNLPHLIAQQDDLMNLQIAFITNQEQNQDNSDILEELTKLDPAPQSTSAFSYDSSSSDSEDVAPSLSEASKEPTLKDHDYFFTLLKDSLKNEPTNKEQLVQSLNDFINIINSTTHIPKTLKRFIADNRVSKQDEATNVLSKAKLFADNYSIIIRETLKYKIEKHHSPDAAAMGILDFYLVRHLKIDNKIPQARQLSNIANTNFPSTIQKIFTILEESKPNALPLAKLALTTYIEEYGRVLNKKQRVDIRDLTRAIELLKTSLFIHEIQLKNATFEPSSIDVTLKKLHDALEEKYSNNPSALPADLIQITLATEDLSNIAKKLTADQSANQPSEATFELRIDNEINDFLILKELQKLSYAQAHGHLKRISSLFDPDHAPTKLPEVIQAYFVIANNAEDNLNISHTKVSELLFTSLHHEGVITPDHCKIVLDSIFNTLDKSITDTYQSDSLQEQPVTKTALSKEQTNSAGMETSGQTSPQNPSQYMALSDTAFLDGCSTDLDPSIDMLLQQANTGHTPESQPVPLATNQEPPHKHNIDELIALTEHSPIGYRQVFLMALSIINDEKQTDSHRNIAAITFLLCGTQQKISLLYADYNKYEENKSKSNKIRDNVNTKIRNNIVTFTSNYKNIIDQKFPEKSRAPSHSM